MFDATLRAVSERRSDRIDEAGADIIRADAHAKRAEMDKVRAEARENVLQIALDGQAKFAAELVGLLARCTVMMGQGSAALAATFAEISTDDETSTTSVVRQVANSMACVAQGNDQAFATLIGATTASFQLARDSALLKFTSHPVPTINNARPAPRTSVGGRPKPPVRASVATGRRRSSSTQSHNSPRRLNPKSPRRPGARASLSRVANARVVEKKSVRWRDETSQGEIDDKGLRPIRRSVSQPVRSITPLLLVTKPESKGKDESEAEWEDERTEDSMSVSSTSSHSTVTGVPASQPPPNNRSIRDRLVRGTRPSPMTSVGEETEGEDSPLKPRRSPLGDVINSPPTSHFDGSPSKRQKASSQARPSTPPNVSPSKPSRAAPVPGSASKTKRVSSIGPLRVEKKSRRRSSLIPRPSPPSAAYSYSYSQPRRTPSKKRRVSVMSQEGGNSSVLWVKPARPAFSQSISADSSSGGIRKPVWR